MHKFLHTLVRLKVRANHQQERRQIQGAREEMAGRYLEALHFPSIDQGTGYAQDEHPSILHDIWEMSL